MLGARAYATRELRQRLVRRGFPEPDVDAAIARLTAAGLLDDAAYARHLTRSRIVGGRAAPRRVRLELARRGVDRATADAAVDAVVEDEAVDPAAALEALARRRAVTLARLDPATRRRRLYAYLARRGYDADDIQAVLRRIDADAAGGSGD